MKDDSQRVVWKHNLRLRYFNPCDVLSSLCTTSQCAKRTCLCGSRHNAQIIVQMSKVTRSQTEYRLTFRRFSRQPFEGDAIPDGAGDGDPRDPWTRWTDSVGEPLRANPRKKKKKKSSKRGAQVKGFNGFSLYFSFSESMTFQACRLKVDLLRVFSRNHLHARATIKPTFFVLFSEIVGQRYSLRGHSCENFHYRKRMRIIYNFNCVNDYIIW